MGHVTTKDEVNLYFEESGTGTPVIFIHEYAGDYRSWGSRRYATFKTLSLHHI